MILTQHLGFTYTLLFNFLTVFILIMTTILYNNKQFYSWADSNTLLLIYHTCIRPHLEYACQLWDPFLNKGMQSLEAVQKFACKVCLKQWDLDYDSMLQLLNLPRLSVHCS